jgi:hypothetical protein
VTYLKPVPVGRALHARAWTQRQEGSHWYVAGELTLASTGAVLARGEAIMVLRDAGHFTRHQQWLADQDAAVRRLRQGRRLISGMSSGNLNGPSRVRVSMSSSRLPDAGAGASAWRFECCNLSVSVKITAASQS